jgi:DNA polymerase III psi subunit
MLHLEPEQISKRAGIQFQETYDDLDYLQLAVICTASNKKFALTRHLHAPVQGVVIHSSSDSKTLAEDLKDILRALEVKSSEVSWVNPDVPISLTKTSKTKSGFFLD